MRQIIWSLFCLLLSSALAAGTQLPLNTLRDQSSTAHCWAYSMSHFLESRALARESLLFKINVEQDVKYWVDYERMHYIFATKEDFFLDSYEGGWQVEFFETLLKHGKTIQESEQLRETVAVRYPLFESFFDHLPFQAVPRPRPDRSLSFSGAKERLLSSEFHTKQEADIFIRDFLNRYYGQPFTETNFLGQRIQLVDSAQALLGSDFSDHESSDRLKLVVPSPRQSRSVGWHRCLSNRYSCYQAATVDLLSWIRRSLDRAYPVTFDNVSHAMTIVGFEERNGTFEYAVADSAGGKITWYSELRLQQNLNLVSFMAKSLVAELPEQSVEHMLLLPPSVNFDDLHNLKRPPGAKIP